LPGRRLPAGHEDHGDVVSRTPRHGARCFGRRADDGQGDALSRQRDRQQQLAIERALRFGARGSAGFIVLFFVEDGPYALPPAKFDVSQIVRCSAIAA
jgi:hypothetical protein